MKKLLLLTVIVLCSCSPDKIKEEPWEQQYIVSIWNACNNGNEILYCITEAEFDKLWAKMLTFPPTGPKADCDGSWTVRFKDKEGIERSGFLGQLKSSPNACINNNLN